MDRNTRMHPTHSHDCLPTLATGRETDAILYTEGNELHAAMIDSIDTAQREREAVILHRRTGFPIGHADGDGCRGGHVETESSAILDGQVRETPFFDLGQECWDSL